MAASNLEPAVWSSPNGVLSEMPCRFAVVERAVANAVITDAAVKQSARPPDPGSPQLATSTRAYSTGNVSRVSRVCPGSPGVFLPVKVGCEIGLCAFVRPRVPCVPCVSRLPPVSFYR